MSCLPLLRLTQRFLLVLCTTTLGLLLGAGAALAEAGKSELLLYCGITMVRPITEIAQAFEKRESEGDVGARWVGGSVPGGQKERCRGSLLAGRAIVSREAPP